MNNRFVDNIRESLKLRKQAALPAVTSIFLAVLVFTLAYIAISIQFVPERKQLAFNFISERGSVTVLSAIFLSMACSFSIASLVVNLRDKTAPILMWVIMAAGFFFLAMDELMQFHERLGVTMKHYADAGIFRNWNDIIVILYGVLALPVIAALLPGILRYRMFFELIVIAFVFYAIHTLIDATQSPRTQVSMILEESAKLLCVMFLALGTFIAFLGALWNSEPKKE